MLIAITVLSVAAAGVMGLLLGRRVGEERRRSEARVAALIALAGVPAAASPLATATDPAESELRPRQADPSIDVSPGAGAPGELFAPLDADTRLRPRLAVAGGLAALLVAVFGLAGGFARSPGGLAQATHAPSGAALELLSLRYEAPRDGVATISGMVHNPRGSVAMARIHVTAALLGTDGGVVATARAPLDVTRIAPGEESPFLVPVHVPASADIGRYRIGFRGDDGRVISHVDRRAVGSLARQ